MTDTPFYNESNFLSKMIKGPELLMGLNCSGRAFLKAEPELSIKVLNGIDKAVYVF